jgi:glycine betaine/proline transport system substrate-binding protein
VEDGRPPDGSHSTKGMRVFPAARTRRGAVLRAGALAAALAIGLTGCGGAKIGDSSASGGSSGSGKCGTINLAVNPWVGYEADSAVITEVAQTKLGCTVNLKNLKEEVAWQGFATNQVDAILENWGHDDLKKQYITDQKVAEEAGETGNIGQIGWYVPPWMAKQYPDITDWNNLNKYADMFKTSESGGKGQLLDGDPSYVTNDEALVANLNLNYKVVYAGSEAALITAFRQAEANHTPLIGYFYSPQWFLSEVPLVKVNLPKYTPGCDADAQKIACDYPTYNLDKIVRAGFAKEDGPGYKLIKAFHWTNDDQNVVAKYISEDKMSPSDAAKKWISANQNKVNAWLS